MLTAFISSSCRIKPLKQTVSCCLNNLCCDRRTPCGFGPHPCCCQSGWCCPVLDHDTAQDVLGSDLVPLPVVTVVVSGEIRLMAAPWPMFGRTKAPSPLFHPRAVTIVSPIVVRSPFCWDSAAQLWLGQQGVTQEEDWWCLLTWWHSAKALLLAHRHHLSLALCQADSRLSFQLLIKSWRPCLEEKPLMALVGKANGQRFFISSHTPSA